MSGRLVFEGINPLVVDGVKLAFAEWVKRLGMLMDLALLFGRRLAVCPKHAF